MMVHQAQDDGSPILSLSAHMHLFTDPMRFRILGASPQLPRITLISGADDCLDPAGSTGQDGQTGYLIYLCMTQENGAMSTRLMILTDPAVAPAATPNAIALPVMAYHPQALSAP